MKTAIRLAGGSLLILALFPAMAGADTWLQVGGDLTLTDRHIWRGVIRDRGWGFQPDIHVTLVRDDVLITEGATLRDVALTFGAWGDADLEGLDWGEINPWVQLASSMGAAEATIGWTPYYYLGTQPLPRPRDSDANTSEFFSTVRFGTDVVGATWAGWFDVGRVKGSYFETSLDFLLPLNPFPWPGIADPFLGTLQFKVLAGWSAGQGRSSTAPSHGFNFRDEGLTHIDFALATSALLGGGLSVEPELHLQVNGDPFTGSIVPEPTQVDRGLTAWFRVTFSPTAIVRTRLP